MRLTAILMTAALWCFPALARATDCQTVAHDWQAFERDVRDGLRPRAELQRQMERWPQRLKTCFTDQGFSSTGTFPLKGYGPENAGQGPDGTRGFLPRGYAFLDGNRHGAHPAVDFFIHDTNQDSRDDATGQPIPVVAMADGVVVSVFDRWQPEGQTAFLRGGNYVWVYHPALDLFSYSAHLAEVVVSTGDLVVAGQTIGTLGRSGLNAYKKRSPTHLHLMVLNAHDMKPVSPLDILHNLGIKKRCLKGGCLKGGCQVSGIGNCNYRCLKGRCQVSGVRDRELPEVGGPRSATARTSCMKLPSPDEGQPPKKLDRIDRIDRICKDKILFLKFVKAANPSDPVNPVEKLFGPHSWGNSFLLE